MGLFDRGFIKRNPTFEWVPDPHLVLEFDFDAHALCGVRLGDPMEKLRRLGMAEDHKFAIENVLRYFSKGLEIGVEDHCVSDFLLMWDDASFEPFGGICRHGGREFSLDSQTTQEAWIQCFGEPYWQDRDRDEILLFYEFPNADLEWQVSFSLEQTLIEMLVCRPLLADEEERLAFKVTKPWPPA